MSKAAAHTHACARGSLMLEKVNYVDRLYFLLYIASTLHVILQCCCWRRSILLTDFLAREMWVDCTPEHDLRHESEFLIGYDGAFKRQKFLQLMSHSIAIQ